MADNSIINPGAGRPAAQTPVGGSNRARSGNAQATGYSNARGSAGQRNPLDLQTAFERLDNLLERDNGRPRSDAPSRGYYLNILA